MPVVFEATKMIPVASISTGQRVFEPTEKHIEQMAASLKSVGQITPIMVHPVTRNTYRLVVGQTRFKAASKLGFTHIRCDIVSGQAIDYRIAELAENADRHDLTAAQRKQSKAELKKLLKERLATVKASKGGRGHKGGMREAARQAGVDRRTAERAVAETKLAHNTDFAPVSAAAQDMFKPSGNTDSRPVSAAAPQPVNGHRSRDRAPILTSIRFSERETTKIKAFNSAHCGDGPFGHCVRKLVREALEAHKAW